MNIKASIITIGDELLIGQTIDTNSAWMAQRLNDLGIDVIRRVAVGDDAKRILAALKEAISETQIIFITGGLGPTKDDITKNALADYFGSKLVMNEKVLAHVTSIFEKRKLPLLDVNLRQAEVPDNCEVLFNKVGTAPGMLFKKNGPWIISLPGVPFEMMTIMEEEVIPRLRQQFISDAIMHVSILTSGMGESFVAEKIKDLEDALPAHIKLAYLPSFGIVKLRLTGRGADKLQLINELKLRQEEIANRLEDIVIALEDAPTEQLIGNYLTVHNQTLALAESCTGGYIAHRITQVMGSGKYFNGSIVCYQNEVKKNLLKVEEKVLKTNGAVCEEVAVQMVKGAIQKLKSDVGLGITGLLSSGGEDDKAAVGTVWIAVGDQKKIVAKEFHFHYDRLRNKELAAQHGLLMIWKFLNGKL